MGKDERYAHLEDEEGEADELPFKNASSDDTSTKDVDELIESLPDGVIPIKFRRNGVHDFRKRKTISIPNSTNIKASEMANEMKHRFAGETEENGDTVQETDVYAAIFKAGLNHINSVEHELQQMGYGMSDSDLVSHVMKAAKENPELIEKFTD